MQAKGAESKPGDLPVEFPTKVELVINLKRSVSPCHMRWCLLRCMSQKMADFVVKVFWSWAAREREVRDSSQNPSREWGFPRDP